MASLLAEMNVIREKPVSNQGRMEAKTEAEIRNTQAKDANLKEMKGNQEMLAKKETNQGGTETEIDAYLEKTDAWLEETKASLGKTGPGWKATRYTFKQILMLTEEMNVTNF
jgi:hypothetical protein